MIVSKRLFFYSCIGNLFNGHESDLNARLKPTFRIDPKVPNDPNERLERETSNEFSCQHFVLKIWFNDLSKRQSGEIAT